MQSDLLDSGARLREHAERVLADLRRMGFEEWELRVTAEHRGPHGLHELWVRAIALDEAKRAVIHQLMRAPGSSRS